MILFVYGFSFFVICLVMFLIYLIFISRNRWVNHQLERAGVPTRINNFTSGITEFFFETRKKLKQKFWFRGHGVTRFFSLDLPIHASHIEVSIFDYTCYSFYLAELYVSKVWTYRLRWSTVDITVTMIPQSFLDIHKSQLNPTVFENISAC